MKETINFILTEYKDEFLRLSAICKDFKISLKKVIKDKDILEEVLGHLRTMRDTWKEVMRQSKMGMTV